MKRSCALVLAITVAAMGTDLPPQSPKETPATSLPASDSTLAPIVKERTPEERVSGQIALSNGRIVRADIFLRGPRQIKIFDKEKERYRYVPLSAIERIDVTVIKEVKEDEWRWLEAANDTKVRTGHFYWWRQYETTITPTRGKPIVGAVRGPVYIRNNNRVERFILHDRDKGKLDAALKDLIFVRSINLGAKLRPTSRPASRPTSRSAIAEPGEPVAPEAPGETIESPE